MAADYKRRIKLHGWAALSFTGFYCSVGIGDTLSAAGRVASLAMAVVGLVATLKSLLAMGPGATLRNNILAYWQWVVESRKGAKAFLSTAQLVVASLGMAVLIGARESSYAIGAASGIRQAVYLVVFAYVWRLRNKWRIATFAVWIACDVFAAAASGGFEDAPSGSGAVTLVVGIFFSWLLLVVHDAIDPAAEMAHPLDDGVTRSGETP